MEKERLLTEDGYLIDEINKSTPDAGRYAIASNYHIMFIVDSGCATLAFSSNKYRLQPRQLMCLPTMLYLKQVEMSDDFSGRIVAATRPFLLDAVVGIPTSYFDTIYSHGAITMSDDNKWTLLCNLIENLKLMQHTNIGPKHHEVTTGTYRSVAIILAGCVDGKMPSAVYSQSDVYFRKFLELIEENVNREHEVTFYAEQLHITAKYLSEISKQKCGHKAKEVISSFLIAKLKQEISLTGKSIKVIAYEYNFADQSSMGKFFNKMTGMSPSEYKRFAPAK